MNVVINNNYEDFREEFHRIIRGDYTPEKVFCNSRNTVELVDIGGKKLVLKKYRKPGLFNGLIYTFFRKTKARRAYEYAEILRAEGIDTPCPVAYFEKSTAGIFREGYFIAEYLDMPDLQKPFYSGGFSPEERTLVANDLAAFTLMLHEKGIVPLDYNMTNIMYAKEGCHYRFALIDINRMQIGSKPGIKASMKAFAQLGTYPGEYFTLLSPYTDGRGFEFEKSLYYLIRYRLRRLRMKNFKRKLKKAIRLDK